MRTKDSKKEFTNLITLYAVSQIVVEISFSHAMRPDLKIRYFWVAPES